MGKLAVSMRLGQLARQLKVKPEDITTYLTTEGVEVKSHPNSKVPDDATEKVTAHFSSVVEEEPEATIEQTKQVEQANIEKEEKPLEPEIPANPEHIETQKTE